MFRSHKDIQITKTVQPKTRKDGEFYCDLCDDDGPFPTETDVEIHRKRVHKQELMLLYNRINIHMCVVCHRQQKSRTMLIRHLKEFHLCCSPTASRITREIFICDYCNKLFFNKQLLATHILNWHMLDVEQKRTTRVHCPKCWRTIKVKSLWFHYLYHDMLNVSTCPICLKSCDSRIDLIDHIKTHPGHFSCNICGYASTKELHFNAHMDKHKKNLTIKSREDVSRYFMPGKNMFPTRNYLYNLYRGITMPGEIQICIICREFCENEEEMRKHILGDHALEKETKSKKHICVCGEEFFNSILLKQHVFKLKGGHKAWVEGTPMRFVEEPPATSDDDQLVVYQLYDMGPVTVDVNVVNSTPRNETTEHQMILNGLDQMEET